MLRAQPQQSTGHVPALSVQDVESGGSIGCAAGFYDDALLLEVPWGGLVRWAEMEAETETETETETYTETNTYICIYTPD